MAVAIACVLAPYPVAADWDLKQMLGKDSNGKTVYRSRPVPQSLISHWPEKLENEFQARARMTIAAQANVKSGVNTYFENEKRSYGYLMAHLLSEQPDKIKESLKAIQTQDHQHQEWHRETDGIDYYAAFTIKHQMRKYFYFGDLLEPEYKQQMFSGARKWTARDPMRRPHYAYKGKKEGWGPDAQNSWVDIRSTENLFLMRVTSVYLMAEETGNKATAEKYKKYILDYAATLIRVGMGEWDSENYHGHSMGPLLNLYDFAKDLEVKKAAKACLDFIFIAGAVKYYRGGFNGPTKRDYNHVQPYGGSAANMLWLMFGDNNHKDGHWESDEVHLITSAYRAPLVAVEIATKKIPKPVEIYSSKPHYSATTGFDVKSIPAYLETQFIGKSFQMGSLAGGTRPGKQDVNGFKIISSARNIGGVVIQGVPGNDPNFIGSPQYQDGKVDGENRVAQYQNIAIWLVQNGNAAWTWLVPESFSYSTKKEVVFLKGHETWIAMRTLGGSRLAIDRQAEEKLSGKKSRKFSGHYVLTCQGNRSKYCGIAIEVGDNQSFKSFDMFVASVLKSEIDDSKLDGGIVQLRDAAGKWLGFHWNDDPHNLGVWKNGTRHDFKEHASYLYRTGSGKELIDCKWGSGELNVKTDGQTYRCRIDPRGKVTFGND